MYGKLFTQMYDGTLAKQGPWQAMVTFQQLIILADRDGVVDMTADAISRRTTIPLAIIELGLTALAQPDIESRSPDEEGRRIVLLDPGRSWGWRLVNYGHYRRIRNEEERRAYRRDWIRDKRAQEREQSEQASTMSTNSSKQEAVSRKQRTKKGFSVTAEPPAANGTEPAWTHRAVDLANAVPLGLAPGRYLRILKAFVARDGADVALGHWREFLQAGRNFDDAGQYVTAERPIPQALRPERFRDTYPEWAPSGAAKIGL